MTVRQALDGVTLPPCPACASTDIRVALEGRSYPIYVCGACHSNFCSPPARASQTDAQVPCDPEVALMPGCQTPDAVRAFGDVRVEICQQPAGWFITIADAGGRCLVRTPAEGTLDEAKAKAERLVGYLPTGPWHPATESERARYGVSDAV